MKKFPLLLIILSFVISIVSCSSDDYDYSQYDEWREANNTWLAEQEALKVNGEAYYQKVVPSYDNGQYVLMHWFNDRSKTAGNLQPYYTSTVDVKYIGRLYDDEAFDSSYLNTETYGDSIYRTKLTSVISGWAIALQEMHVGDSVEVIIPYQSAYGLTGSGSTILPFSNLKFNIKLVNIPYWEINQ